jgi:hypothetical protein
LLKLTPPDGNRLAVMAVDTLAAIARQRPRLLFLPEAEEANGETKFYGAEHLEKIIDMLGSGGARRSIATAATRLVWELFPPTGWLEAAKASLPPGYQTQGHAGMGVSSQQIANRSLEAFRDRIHRHPEDRRREIKLPSSFCAYMQLFELLVAASFPDVEQRRAQANAARARAAEAKAAAAVATAKTPEGKAEAKKKEAEAAAAVTAAEKAVAEARGEEVLELKVEVGGVKAEKNIPKKKTPKKKTPKWTKWTPDMDVPAEPAGPKQPPAVQPPGGSKADPVAGDALAGRLLVQQILARC